MKTSDTITAARRRDTIPPGFSLIELLTVIAIIGVLAALLFPALLAQQAKAHRNACASNLEAIAGGLRMYRLDTGYYPPVLYGFVHAQDEGTPGTETYGLYPHWVTSATTFACPDNPALREMDDREAVRLGMNGAKPPYLTPVVVPQELRTGKWVVNSQPDTLLYKSGIKFAVGDSYDVSFLPTKGMRSGAGSWERHYQLQWTPVVNLTDVPAANAYLKSLQLLGSTLEEQARTYARQLIFRQPDDSTVVTMCTYHRVYPSGWTYPGTLPAENTDVVLFLDGHVEMRQSADMNIYGPLGWAGWQRTER